MRPPSERSARLHKIIKASAAGVLVLSSFVMGAMTQRVENAIAIEDTCTRTADGIACLIVLTEADDDDDDEPPGAS